MDVTFLFNNGHKFLCIFLTEAGQGNDYDEDEEIGNNLFFVAFLIRLFFQNNDIQNA